MGREEAVGVRIDDGERFAGVMGTVLGRRITYRQLCEIDGCGFMGLEQAMDGEIYEPTSEMGKLLLALVHLSAHNGPYLLKGVNVGAALRQADEMANATAQTGDASGSPDR